MPTITDGFRESRIISEKWSGRTALIALNILLDAPILLYTLTGYYWKCELNQVPNIFLPTILSISTLVLIWSAFRLNKHTGEKESFWALFTTVQGLKTSIHNLLFFLSALLTCLAICYLSFSTLLWFGEQIGSGVDSTTQSPNTLRIATLCAEACGDSCLSHYSLRVGDRFLPFVDRNVGDLKYGPPDYFVPQIKWADNSTIVVTEAGNIGNSTRIVRVGLVNFNWLYALIFISYAGMKYGYVAARMQIKKRAGNYIDASTQES
jgi:hypothetical protein